LIFLSLQNAKITTHFAQEGDFAAKAVFAIFLFLVPFFITKLVLVIVNEQGSRLLFWLELVCTTAFPTVIIGGLFIPKFIIIAKEGKVKRKSINVRNWLALQ
jgi:hypothetical protein